MLPAFLKNYHWASQTGRAANAARKPNSVPAAGLPRCGRRSFIWDAALRRRLKRPTREHQAGHPRTLPYLVLHRVGFT